MIHEIISKPAWEVITSNYKDIQKFQYKLVTNLAEIIYGAEDLISLGEYYSSFYSVCSVEGRSCHRFPHNCFH